MSLVMLEGTLNIVGDKFSRLLAMSDSDFEINNTSDSKSPVQKKTTPLSENHVLRRLDIVADEFNETCCEW